MLILTHPVDFTPFLICKVFKQVTNWNNDNFWLNYSLCCNTAVGLLFLNRVQRTFSSSGGGGSGSDEDSSASRPLPLLPPSKSSTRGLRAASTSRGPPPAPNHLSTRHSSRKPTPSSTPKRPPSHRSPDKFSIPPPPSPATTPRLSVQHSTQHTDAKFTLRPSLAYSYIGRVIVRHSTRVVGVGQTLRRWAEGATYIRQGDHHVGPHSHSSCYLRAFYFSHVKRVLCCVITLPRDA